MVLRANTSPVLLLSTLSTCPNDPWIKGSFRVVSNGGILELRWVKIPSLNDIDSGLDLTILCKFRRRLAVSTCSLMTGGSVALE